MTCIVGIQSPAGVYIGGDSASVSGWSQELRTDKKVFQVGEFLFGIAGSWRMADLLRFGFEPPTLADVATSDAALARYMVVDFVPALRSLLESGGARKKENEIESMGDGIFLIGVRGRLFEVCSDFQVGQPSAGYCAIGSGFAVALGALHATNIPDWHPTTRIGMALAAAEAHNIGVRAPFTVATIGGATS